MDMSWIQMDSVSERQMVRHLDHDRNSRSPFVLSWQYQAYSTVFILLLSGLELGTFDFRIHSKMERFKVRFSNVPFSNVPFLNIRSEKLRLAQVVLYIKLKLFVYIKRSRLIATFFRNLNGKHHGQTRSLYPSYLKGYEAT